jgi:hypothetical protein
MSNNSNNKSGGSEFDAVMSELLGEKSGAVDGSASAAPAADAMKIDQQHQQAAAKKPRAPANPNGAAFDVYVGTKAALEGEKPRKAASLYHAVSSFVEGQPDDVACYEVTVVKGKDMLMTFRSLKAPGGKHLKFLRKMSRRNGEEFKVDKEKKNGSDYIVLRKRKNSEEKNAAKKKTETEKQKQKSVLGVKKDDAKIKKEKKQKKIESSAEKKEKKKSETAEQKEKKKTEKQPATKETVKPTDVARKRIEKAMKALKKVDAAADQDSF